MIYRCDATNFDYARLSVESHHRDLAIREERVAATLDTWLSKTFIDPNIIQTTVTDILQADRHSSDERQQSIWPVTKIQRSHTS